MAVSILANGKAAQPIGDLSSTTEVIAPREFRNYYEIGFFRNNEEDTAPRKSDNIEIASESIQSRIFINHFLFSLSRESSFQTVNQ